MELDPAGLFLRLVRLAARAEFEQGHDLDLRFGAGSGSFGCRDGDVKVDEENGVPAEDRSEVAFGLCRRVHRRANEAADLAGRVLGIANTLRYLNQRLFDELPEIHGTLLDETAAARRPLEGSTRSGSSGEPPAKVSFTHAAARNLTRSAMPLVPLLRPA